MSEKRSFDHLFVLALLLSLSAGMVNATGYFAFSSLVTNVTGYFAMIAHNVVDHAPLQSLEGLVFVASFFLGAFASNCLMIPARRRGRVFVFAAPIALEIVLLAVTWIRGPGVVEDGPAPIAFEATLLLFAMGLQNATVTVVSGSVVRTTHLTGMLTDLGIMSSRLLFDDLGSERSAVRNRVVLYWSIVLCFTLGALIGGILYDHVHFHSLLLPICLLILAWIYEAVQKA